MESAGRRAKTVDEPGFVAVKVAAALAKYEGDMESATAALVRQAIPDAMELLDRTRTGGRYDVVAHPALPEILHKQSAHGPDRSGRPARSGRAPTSRRGGGK
ncbi:hypothetical protein [Streptomyces sp. CA-253872]|uniref:hypothetical protein n=1 Tax=Streptomyces sp. CA-253872 TaxID=3240067 RepID=UPI003D8D00B1